MDLFLGNVVGSNIFNVLLCLGAAGALAPTAAEFRPLVVDLGVLVCLTLAAHRGPASGTDHSAMGGAVLLVWYLGFRVHLLLHR